MHFYIALTIGSILLLYFTYFLSKREGFLEEQVVDLLFVMAGAFLLFGKIAYLILNPRIYGYYNLNSIMQAGYDVCFGTVFAIFFSYIYIRLFRRWSLYKVCDVLVKGLSIFLTALYFGSFEQYGNQLDLFSGGFWFLMFLVFNFLDKGLMVGRSAKVYKVRRFKPFVFAGLNFYLFTITLILFLTSYSVLVDVKLLIAKVVLYFVLFLITITYMAKEVENSNFVESIRKSLLLKKKKIEKEEAELKTQDPSQQDYQDGETAVEEGDAVAFDLEKESLVMQKGMYAKLKGTIEKTLALINLGKYGKCEKCGGKIEEARLKANPYATTCVSCANK